jgi:type IX secretion system PorP/SprF family membrane protein
MWRMIKIRVLFLLLFLPTFTSVKGQAVSEARRISLGYPVFSQYLHNGLIINPAYAGTRGVLSSFLSYRFQWMGTKGSPVMQSVSFHTPMKNEKIALGMTGQFMQYGFTKSTSIYADYSYNIRLKNGKLYLGLKGGVDVSNTDYTNILLINPGDPVFSSSDKPYVLPNIGAGVYYFNNRYFAGVSVPAFLSYRKTGTGSVMAYNSFGEYDFLISAGALFTLSDILKFRPSILIDYSLQDVKRVTQFDINGNLILRDLIWFGASWRISEQVLVGILQVQLNPQFMFGFSYDYPAGRMNSYSKGSSEFILRYEFRYKVSAANPRYF